ncbi:MAG: immunity 17 family protein [Bacteroidota bacterium]
MNEDLFVGLLLVAFGSFTIIASALNWDFFFEHRKAQFFVKTFGRNGARIFYSVLGIGFIALAILKGF